mgnify:CR=1 FL=1
MHFARPVRDNDRKKVGTMANVHELLDTWIEHVDDPELLQELTQLKEAGDEEAITDAFFQDLAFGTAGLRGTIGAGTKPHEHLHRGSRHARGLPTTW